MWISFCFCCYCYPARPIVTAINIGSIQVWLIREFVFCHELGINITFTYWHKFCQFLRVFTKVRKVTISFVMSLSVRLHRTNWLPRNGFSWNLIFFSENRAVYDILCKKYGATRQATHGNMMLRRKHVLCMRVNYSETRDAHL